MKQVLNLPHSRHWLWLSLCFLLAVESISAQPAAPSCTHADKPEFYVQENYRVRTVAIKSPLGLTARSLATLKADLPLQAGQNFSLDELSAGRAQIEKHLEDQLKDLAQNVGDGLPNPRLRIRVILARIENCHETEPRELDVTYWVITSEYNSYFNHTWELKTDESARPDAASDVIAQTTEKKRSFLSFAPYADYNRTRQLFGGAQVRMRMPKGVFESLDLNAGGSSAGSVASLDLVGSLQPERTALNRLDYRLGYQHIDLPAENNRLRRGVMHFQLFGATKPLGARQVVVRFGATLEGGNQQTDLTREADNANSVASSGYGALKTYIGATARFQNYALAGAYGLQAGTQGATTKLAFVKHIGDLSLTARWTPKPRTLGEVHRAITLEAQFSAGAIQSRGRVPVTERFFGGNAAQYFLTEDSWRMRSGPFIRSIPQNRLGSAVGGTSFYSLNSTVAWAVWGYPLLPKDLVADPEFPEKWEGAQNIAQSALQGSYLSKFPELFAPIISHLAPAQAPLAEIKESLNSLADPPDNLSEEDQRLYARTIQHLIKTRALLNRGLSSEKEKLPGKLEGYLKEKDRNTCMGFPWPPPPEDDDEDPTEDLIQCSLFTRLHFELQDFAQLLRKANLTQEADKIERARNTLNALQSNLITEFDQIDKSGAKKLAEADMQAVRPILKAIKDEINIVAISPVAVFDVARIWPDRYGARYGIGGGVRLTLVNFNVTLGYAVNPQPRLREGRGAFFFAMDVTNLFR